jgi:hypothetical protein
VYTLETTTLSYCLLLTRVIQNSNAYVSVEHPELLHHSHNSNFVKITENWYFLPLEVLIFIYNRSADSTNRGNEEKGGRQDKITLT